MRNILSTILVFILSLSLVGVAMAAAAKPPASFCFTPGYGFIYALVVKPSSNIKMSDGTEKFYKIQGGFIGGGFNTPVAGSGYIEGNIFHFTVDSTYTDSGTARYIKGEGFWDPIAKTGTMYAYFSVSGNWIFPLTEETCSNYQILYSSGAALPNDGSPLSPRK